MDFLKDALGEDFEVFKENKRACEAEAKCAELQEWIDRLLEYTEMSEEDMKRVIKKEKDTAEVMERVDALFGFGRKFGGGYFYKLKVFIISGIHSFYLLTKV